MSYATQSLIAVDPDFIARCTSCTAVEVPSTPLEPHPADWVNRHIWHLATAPSFDTKYESAMAAGIARPGWEPSVISDADILSAVQAEAAKET